MSLLKEHLAYMARVRAHGGRILAYRPPCCNTETETKAPVDDDDVWDSLTTCPHCGALGMKIVTRNTVEIRLLEA
jgi:hypothetical protein